MTPALLIVAALFGLLLLVRLAGVERKALARRWPAILFAVAAIYALFRGGLWPAAALGLAAALAWIVWPQFGAAPNAGPDQPTANSSEDAAARAALGVGPTATDDDIRRAYRSKMARAHPDRGGSHAEAARLTAARDRLLRKR